MGKKVLISGYIGFSNFGDDIIFSLLVRHLKAQGYEPIALSANPKMTQEQFKIKAYDYKNPLAIFEAISSCSYLYSGGGSLLQDATSSRSLVYYLLIILFAKLMFKKVVIFAQGIGPIYSKINEKRTKFILSLCDLITIRDEDSFNLLKRWKINCRRVIDPAWDIVPICRENQGHVGVQLRHYDIMSKNFVQQLAKYVGIYFSDRTIKIFSFQNEQDLEICYRFERELKSQWPQMRTEIIVQSSINNTLENFSKLEYLIAMRYHAVLLGLKYGLKTMALSYDPKVASIAKEFELQTIDVSKKTEEFNDKFGNLIRYQERGYIAQKRQVKFDWQIFDNFMKP